MEHVQEQLELLKIFAQGLAAHFGPGTEVVIHDYAKPVDQTIVHIENGHITNRKVGDCGTNFTLETHGKGKRSENRCNVLGQCGGKMLRSSSIYLRNSAGDIIGSVCINTDITDMMLAEAAVKKLMNLEGTPKVEEFFTNDVDELLDTLIASSIEYVGVPAKLMDKEQKGRGINYLNDKGAFRIKHAAEKIGRAYGMSRYTVYNYLNRQ